MQSAVLRGRTQIALQEGIDIRLLNKREETLSRLSSACLFVYSTFQDLSVAICWSSDYTYLKSQGLCIYLTVERGAKGKHMGGSSVAKTCWCR